MTTYDFGDVVITRIKFSGQHMEKPRPAVVISNLLYHSSKTDVMVASITSNLYCDEHLGEFIISGLSSTGLKVPSRVKAFISTVDPMIIKYKAGHLNETDGKSLRLMLNNLFSLYKS